MAGHYKFSAKYDSHMALQNQRKLMTSTNVAESKPEELSHEIRRPVNFRCLNDNVDISSATPNILEYYIHICKYKS